MSYTLLISAFNKDLKVVDISDLPKKKKQLVAAEV